MGVAALKGVQALPEFIDERQTKRVYNFERGFQPAPRPDLFILIVKQLLRKRFDKAVWADLCEKYGALCILIVYFGSYDFLLLFI